MGELYINVEMFVTAILIVSVFLAITSMPRILLVSVITTKRYNCHRAVRKYKNKSEVPAKLARYYAIGKDSILFQKAITDELEKIVSLKDDFGKALLSIIITVILLIYPGFAYSIEPFLIAFVVIMLEILIILFYHLGRLTNQYVKLLEENNQVKKHPEMMYG